MQWFNNWWEGLTILQQTFACAALPATVILFLQSILLLFGLGGDHDADGAGDIDHDTAIDHTGEDPVSYDHDPEGNSGAEHASGVRLFTVRGLVAFFAVGGWLGIAMIDLGAGAAVSAVIAFVGGFAALLAIAYILKLFLSLQESGNIIPQNAVDKTGTVYLRIPASRTGKGKVNLTLQDRYVEMDAVTDNATPILRDSQVKVLDVIDDNTLVVCPLVTVNYTTENGVEHKIENEKLKV